ncbi:MAG: DUF1598 domain-containing protein [Planctomycetes bacterium]|nr:DUF1598 domain-containing protein [Planctomycetota bacterium]
MKPVCLGSRLAWSALAMLVVIAIGSQSAQSQFVQQRSVGGVAIDVDGVVSAPSVEDQRELAQVRETALAEVPADFSAFTELRGVSLKQLEATIAKCRAENRPIPEEVQCLAGLQRVEYVLVYPDQNDIVLAGPAEGWRMDALGNVVGVTTGRSVVLLDDLIVALRSSESSRLEAISCSIDPTPQGMQRLQAVVSRMRTMGDPQTTMGRLEEALGPQVVSVTGVPSSSHFARVMVAADFRMKRLAMNFQPAPIDNLPSFLHLVSGRSKSSMTPRWWLAANYEPLARDAAGLTWQLRGQGVQCLTEEDHFNAVGQRVSSGKASRAAQRWAQMLTERYSELADHDSAFGQLRNVMDLAVVAALFDKEQLLVRAGLDLPQLLGELQIAEYPTPRQVATKASFIKRRGSYTISASGGVQILPWQIADRTEEVSTLGDVREEVSPDSQQWWLQ